MFQGFGANFVVSSFSTQSSPKRTLRCRVLAEGKGFSVHFPKSLTKDCSRYHQEGNSRSKPRGTLCVKNLFKADRRVIKGPTIAALPSSGT